MDTMNQEEIGEILKDRIESLTNKLMASEAVINEVRVAGGWDQYVSNHIANEGARRELSELKKRLVTKD